MCENAPEVDRAAEAIRSRWRRSPVVGVVLGTGLGNLSAHVKVDVEIGYGNVPGFSRPTATSHDGQLVCGTAAGVAVMIMKGRLHQYEGYSLRQITLPVRVMKALGVELLVLSNASGGLNPNYSAGDVVLICDHVNFTGEYPLYGAVGSGSCSVTSSRRSRLFHGPMDGPSDLSSRCASSAHVSSAARTDVPYDRELIVRALTIARHGNIPAHQGVYAAVVGPNYETRAEYRLLRLAGCDLVGMSTVPEVVVAAQLGMRVLALSVVTNVCRPDHPTRTRGQDVVAVAADAEPKIRELILGVLAREMDRVAGGGY